MNRLTTASLTVTLAVLLYAESAHAAFVSVQWPTGSQQLAFPQVATASGAGYAAQADLGTGVFEAASSVVDGNSLAYAGFSLLQIRYVAPASDPTRAWVIPEGWLTANVTASLAVAPMPGSASGFNSGLLQANLAAVVGTTSYTAAVSHQVVETPGGGGSVTTDTSGSQNGGQAVINAASASTLDVALRLPELVVAPNGILRLSGLLQTNVLSNFGPVGVDASNTYALGLQLPADFAGSLINTATGQPFTPGWITPVPLPASGALLWAAIGGLAALRARRRATTT